MNPTMDVDGYGVERVINKDGHLAQSESSGVVPPIQSGSRAGQIATAIDNGVPNSKADSGDGLARNARSRVENVSLKTGATSSGDLHATDTWNQCLFLAV